MDTHDQDSWMARKPCWWTSRLQLMTMPSTQDARQHQAALASCPVPVDLSCVSRHQIPTEKIKGPSVTSLSIVICNLTHGLIFTRSNLSAVNMIARSHDGKVQCKLFRTPEPTCEILKCNRQLGSVGCRDLGLYQAATKARLEVVLFIHSASIFRQSMHMVHATSSYASPTCD